MERKIWSIIFDNMRIIVISMKPIHDEMEENDRMEVKKNDQIEEIKRKKNEGTETMKNHLTAERKNNLMEVFCTLLL